MRTLPPFVVFSFLVSFASLATLGACGSTTTVIHVSPDGSDNDAATGLDDDAAATGDDASSLSDGSTPTDATTPKDAGSDPCTSATGPDGTYCAVDLPALLGKGPDQNLYDCRSRHTVGKKACATVCAGGAKGLDFCDPCGALAAGYYCLDKVDPSALSVAVVRCSGSDLISIDRCNPGRACTVTGTGTASCAP